MTLALTTQGVFRMGSWSISIHGHGIHDNGKEGDVDALLQEFIRELKEKGGHQIDAVHLTVGSGRKYAEDPADRDHTGTGYF